MSVRIVRDETDNQYHASDAVSSSLLKTLWAKDAQTAEYERTHPRADNATLARGRAVHSLVLGAGSDVETKLDGRTKAGKEQAARAEEEDTILLTPSDMAAVEGMTEAILNHETGTGLLEGTERETSIYWKDAASGLDVRARLDAFDEFTIVDLKTTRDPTPRAFNNQAASLAYLVQAGLYTIGWQQAHDTDRLPNFYFLVVGNSAPHQVGAYQVDTPDLTLGMDLAGHLLDRWAGHVRDKDFPGLPARLHLKPPAWATHRMREALA